MHELVIYKNDLNSIILPGFNETELKLFFAICSRLKDHGSEEVRFNFSYLKEITNEKKHYTQTEYAEVIKNMYHKLIGLRFVYETENEEGEINLFQGYEHSFSDHSFAISVTPKFQYLFNSLENSFTIWSLEEFVNLPGIYPKQLYRLLKQWRTVGHASYAWDVFKEMLDIPKSYQTKDITRRIVVPAINKLRELDEFKTLNYRFSTHNRKVVRVMFDWTPEPQKYVEKGKSMTPREALEYDKKLKAKKGVLPSSSENQ